MIMKKTLQSNNGTNELTPKIKYTGSIRDADKAIEDYRRRTGHKGGVIAIPESLWEILRERG
uniref:Uncharacterized protein n=1 Tax=viral metagenome TaxID=1070528 RepID=A0A6M3J3C2_9ZZZZ